MFLLRFCQLLLLISSINADLKSHRYELHEKVELMANKISPYFNPSETYGYYSLPYCKHPDEEEEGSSSSSSNSKNNVVVPGDNSFRESLAGDRKFHTPYVINYKVDVQWRELCTKTLTLAEMEMFEEAVEDQYYFEMFLDDLPLYGYVGETLNEDLLLGHTEESQHFIYPHLHFTITYNEDRIVSADVSVNPSDKVDITNHEPTTVTFTYSVTWNETSEIIFEERENYGLNYSFLPNHIEVHWISLLNSFVLVILLTAFLGIILMRMVKNDFSRYMLDDEMGEMDITETGWKLIHNHVFRFPQNQLFFCSIIGSGVHLFITAFAVIALALLHVFHVSKRGSIMTALLVIYSLTAGVGGFVSSKLFKQMGGINWVWNTCLTFCIFPVPLITVFTVINTTAITHRSTAALPFGTILVIASLLLLVALPLTVIGAIAGKNTTSAGGLNVPCRTARVRREIPKGPWYSHKYILIFSAGLLPFSAIYIEIFYIFTSIWGQGGMYTLFGILMLSFILLTLVSSFITVSLVYILLVGEDYRWWWMSIFFGGSTGFFVFLYSFFFYYTRSEMSGFMQMVFYFGYMGIVSYGFFLMLGSIGFISSLLFVKYVYGSIKFD